MRIMDVEAACEYLDCAKIEQTIMLEHADVNVGLSQDGRRFVLVYDREGNAVLSESL